MTLKFDVEVVQIEKLFASSSHKKVWDHFTKAQRKNIELWKKSAMVGSTKHANRKMAFVYSF